MSILHCTLEAKSIVVLHEAQSTVPDLADLVAPRGSSYPLGFPFLAVPCPSRKANDRFVTTRGDYAPLFG